MEDKLQQAVEAYQNGDLAAARPLVEQLLADEPRNEDAWVLMALLQEQKAAKKECLEKVLSINPENEDANRLMIEMETDDMGFSPDFTPEELASLSVPAAAPPARAASGSGPVEAGTALPPSPESFQPETENDFLAFFQAADQAGSAKSFDHSPVDENSNGAKPGENVVESRPVSEEGGEPGEQSEGGDELQEKKEEEPPEKSGLDAGEPPVPPVPPQPPRSRRRSQAAASPWGGFSQTQLIILAVLAVVTLIIIIGGAIFLFTTYF